MAPIPAPDPPPPRRCDWPLPAYRFVPGLNAHPFRHPDGHRARPPADPDACWRYACDLFDQRYWWEAHEAWEGLWRVARGVRRDRLQGLIQAAACLLKLHMGERDGAERLLGMAAARLGDDPLVEGLRGALAGGPPPRMPA